MADFIEQPAFEIGRRVEVRESYAWFVLLRPSAEPEEALDNFLAELSAVLAQPVRIVPGVATSLEQVLAELSEPRGDPVLMSGLDQADMDYWRALDINRSGRALRKHCCPGMGGTCCVKCAFGMEAGAWMTVGAPKVRLSAELSAGSHPSFIDYWREQPIPPVIQLPARVDPRRRWWSLSLAVRAYFNACGRSPRPPLPAKPPDQPGPRDRVSTFVRVSGPYGSWREYSLHVGVRLESFPAGCR